MGAKGMWTAAMDDQLRELYPDRSNANIAGIMNMNIHQVSYRAKRLDLLKTDDYRSSINRVDLTEEQIEFVKANYDTMTNRQIASVLGLRIQHFRSKVYKLGLFRIQLEYWTEEQVEFLKANFQEKGDIELAKIFNNTWPKQKSWSNKHIEKKRKYLGLKRTAAEIKKILAPMWEPGGALYQVHNLNASTLLSDRYVANTMARNARRGINVNARDELMKHPGIIELKRQQLILQRTIKQHGNRKQK